MGLGNPGPEYQSTRHNVGFRAVDMLAQKLGCKIDKAKFQGLHSQVNYSGGKLFLLKPQTFMNNSGDAVKLAGAFYKLPPERILVISDDISLAVGRIRVREEGSAGGHNGLKSIIAMLDSQAFPRVKIGVGAKPDYDLADWVLSSFSAGEEKDLKLALEHAAKAVEDVLAHGVPHAANLYNRKA